MQGKEAQRASVAELRALFDVRPEDGRLIRRTTYGKYRAGSLAGSKTNTGYWQVHVGQRHFLAHRVVWAITHGVWPEQEIDHINGVRDDNRPVNLRDVSTITNNQNRRCKNSQGLPGVVKRANRFAAQIRVNKTTRHLGSFKTAQEASDAFMAAKRALQPGCTF